MNLCEVRRIVCGDENPIYQRLHFNGWIFLDGWMRTLRGFTDFCTMANELPHTERPGKYDHLETLNAGKLIVIKIGQGMRTRLCYLTHCVRLYCNTCDTYSRVN